MQAGLFNVPLCNFQVLIYIHLYHPFPELFFVELCSQRGTLTFGSMKNKNPACTSI
jgi:hypothetical protein